VLERDIKDVKRLLTEKELQELDSDIGNLIWIRRSRDRDIDPPSVSRNTRLLGSSSSSSGSGSGSVIYETVIVTESIGLGQLHYIPKGGVDLFNDYKSGAKIISDFRSSKAIEMRHVYDSAGSLTPWIALLMLFFLA
jgi:hypothetical protein